VLIICIIIPPINISLIFFKVKKIYFQVLLFFLSGFEDAYYGCCGTGTSELGFLCNEYTPFTCTDADKYVFWDAVHPTEKTSRIVAKYLMNTTFSTFK
jgi:GDSL-like Lipase/Acylhydrolase